MEDAAGERDDKKNVGTKNEENTEPSSTSIFRGCDESRIYGRVSSYYKIGGSPQIRSRRVGWVGWAGEGGNHCVFGCAVAH